MVAKCHDFFWGLTWFNHPKLLAQDFPTIRNPAPVVLFFLVYSQIKSHD
jgi:hypothetical protein